MSPISRYGIPLALIALAGAAHPAQAQIVKDGDFESAASGPPNSTFYFTNATPFDANWVITGEVGIDNTDVYVLNGSKSLGLNSGIGIDSITQNLETTPGTTYTLSFYANDDAPMNLLDTLANSPDTSANSPDISGDLLNVSFGNVTLDPISVPANGYDGPGAGNQGRFTFYSYNVTATSLFSGLTFSSVGSLNSGTLELDDISVQPVPEPSTAASLGLLLGMGGALILARKNVRSSKTPLAA